MLGNLEQVTHLSVPCPGLCGGESHSSAMGSLGQRSVQTCRGARDPGPGCALPPEAPPAVFLAQRSGGSAKSGPALVFSRESLAGGADAALAPGAAPRLSADTRDSAHLHIQGFCLKTQDEFIFSEVFLAAV